MPKKNKANIAQNMYKIDFEKKNARLASCRNQALKQAKQGPVCVFLRSHCSRLQNRSGPRI